MLIPDYIVMNESMSLAELVNLNGIQELPQLSAIIQRRISTEAGLPIISEEGDCAVANQVSFLEETVCELVDLVAKLEMEVEESRRFKWIPR